MARRLAVLFVVAVLGAVAPPLVGAEPTRTDPVVVSVDVPLRAINRNLVGIHGRDDAAAIASRYDDLAPTTFRHVMSDHDFLDVDCTTGTLSPSSIDYFTSWIDAVVAEGARPILSLSYVPPCFARDAQPKGPPTPDGVAGYRAFLDDLFAALVTDRVAAGEEPMRWFELWNEPDIPIDAGNPASGHGYVGTLDEYVALNLPSLVAAIQKAEADSGVDLQVGSPAAFGPWTFGSVYGDLATMLERANGFDRATAEAIAAQADDLLGEGTTERVMGNGGLAWPRRVTDEAAALGLTVDFASVHLYPNNPLQVLRFPEPEEPALLQGRNPDASPEDFARLAEMWSAAFPDQELVVSEWALSGDDDRLGTCEATAFDAASLSVMQRSAIDRALYLVRPRRVEDAPFRAWTSLPATEVEASLPDGLDGVWSTAAADLDRTTLLLSQWHARLEDGAELSVPVVVDGLADGTYTVTVEVLGEGTSPAMATIETAVEASGGRLQLPDPVALRGQSLVRVDIRAAGVEPLPPLTEADPTGAPDRCLLAEDPTTTTTSTTTTTTSTTTSTSTTTTTSTSTTSTTTTPTSGSSSTTTAPTGGRSATPATPIVGPARFAG